MGGNDENPVVLKSDSVMGRYLVAARNIKPGELIFQDNPIIMCPNAPTDGDSIVCLGCCGITQKSVAVACSRCGWPLCREECGDVRLCVNCFLLQSLHCLCARLERYIMYLAFYIQHLLFLTFSM